MPNRLVSSKTKTPPESKRKRTAGCVGRRDAGRDVGCWVERPSELQSWFQENKRTLEHDDLYGKKYEWYVKDAGLSTLREIVELLETAAAGRPIKCNK